MRCVHHAIPQPAICVICAAAAQASRRRRRAIAIAVLLVAPLAGTVLYLQTRPKARDAGDGFLLRPLDHDPL